jgi:uncharacterized protein
MNETPEPEVLVYGAPVGHPLVLNEVEVRVLGALMEKQITTPDYYPLTLNALLNACNQTSSRDPVVHYDESIVARALERLREQKLVYFFSGAESRVPKYGQNLTEKLNLTAAETAVLGLLLLRGPQTVGELRSRSGRLHEFASLLEVEATMSALSVKTPHPLVVKLPRQTGFKESRYAHLLSGPPTESSAPVTPSPVVSPVADSSLEAEVAALRQDVADLKQQFAAFRKQFE